MSSSATALPVPYTSCSTSSTINTTINPSKQNNRPRSGSVCLKSTQEDKDKRDTQQLPLSYFLHRGREESRDTKAACGNDTAAHDGTSILSRHASLQSGQSVITLTWRWSLHTREAPGGLHRRVLQGFSRTCWTGKGFLQLLFKRHAVACKFLLDAALRTYGRHCERTLSCHKGRKGLARAAKRRSNPLSAIGRWVSPRNPRRQPHKRGRYWGLPVLCSLGFHDSKRRCQMRF